MLHLKRAGETRRVLICEKTNLSAAKKFQDIPATSVPTLGFRYVILSTPLTFLLINWLTLVCIPLKQVSRVPFKNSLWSSRPFHNSLQQLLPRSPIEKDGFPQHVATLTTIKNRAIEVILRPYKGNGVVHLNRDDFLGKMLVYLIKMLSPRSWCLIRSPRILRKLLCLPYFL